MTVVRPNIRATDLNLLEVRQDLQRLQFQIDDFQPPPGEGFKWNYVERDIRDTQAYAAAPWDFVVVRDRADRGGIFTVNLPLVDDDTRGKAIAVKAALTFGRGDIRVQADGTDRIDDDVGGVNFFDFGDNWNGDVPMFNKTFTFMSGSRDSDIGFWWIPWFYHSKATIAGRATEHRVTLFAGSTESV